MDIEKNWDNKDINGPLLREPESKFKTANLELIQRFFKNYSGAIRNRKPDTLSFLVFIRRNNIVAMKIHKRFANN